MSANETLVDIVAEMRGIANSIQNRLQPLDTPTIFGKPIAVYFVELADRLEAAAKREIEDAERRGNHAATKAICETIEKVGPLYDAESIGNAVKMREALEEALNHLQNAECKVVFLDEVREVENKIRIALAAPPRNCDRHFADRTAMMDEFKKWCRAKGYTMQPYLDWDAFDWLLAEATAEEGGAE